MHALMPLRNGRRGTSFSLKPNLFLIVEFAAEPSDQALQIACTRIVG